MFTGKEGREWGEQNQPKESTISFERERERERITLLQ